MSIFFNQVNFKTSRWDVLLKHIYKTGQPDNLPTKNLIQAEFYLILLIMLVDFVDYLKII
jgi:hypothetical protein